MSVQKIYSSLIGSDKHDYVFDSAVDSNGNIFMVGLTKGATFNDQDTPLSNYNYGFVIKKNSSGQTQWTKFIECDVNSDYTQSENNPISCLNGVEIDSQDNVYVCGYTWGDYDGNTLNGSGLTTVRNALLIKLSNSDGTNIWSSFYGQNRAEANNLSFDSSGTIYMIGYTSTDYEGISITESGSHSRLFISKIDPDDGSHLGGKILEESYPVSAESIKVDSNDNIYVYGFLTGRFLLGANSDLNHDLLLLRLDTNLNLIFVKTYERTHDENRREMEVVDGDDNEQNRYKSQLAIDNLDQIYLVGHVAQVYESGTYLTGGTFNDIAITGYSDGFIMKVNSSGSVIWTKLIGTANQNSKLYGVSIDQGNNIYVSGNTNGDKSIEGVSLDDVDHDQILAKYDSDGNQQWIEIIKTDYLDKAISVEVDNKRNIYTLGVSKGDFDGNSNQTSPTSDSSIRDITLVKYYDPSGYYAGLLEVSLIGSTQNNTPSLVFHTNVSTGKVITSLTQGILSGDTITASGDQTITFNELPDADYTGETISIVNSSNDILTDMFGNPLTLTITDFSIDNIPPILTEITAISSLPSGNTPQYVFSSNKAGTISTSITEGLSSGEAVTASNNIITFNQLPDGVYSMETITVTDAAGNSSTLSLGTFTIDTVEPSLEEVSSIGNSLTATPSFTLRISEGGTLTTNLAQGLSSETIISTGGDYIVSFNHLPEGTHDDVTITLTDQHGNSSTLNLTSFTINSLVSKDNLQAAVSTWISGDSTTYGPINNWNTELITDMSGLFENTDFNDDISNWDTSSVINMDNMFNNNPIFNQSINDWDLSSLQSANQMFKDAIAINQQFLNFHDKGVRFSGSTGNVIAHTSNSGVNVDSMFEGALSQRLKGGFCFPKGTPVSTDQGILPIEQITSENSINGTTVSKVVSFFNKDNHMVLFLANSLGENIPCQNTLMTLNHKIKYNNEMIRAHKMVNDSNILKIKATPNEVFNILMSGNNSSTMYVNNLCVETMNPRSLNRRKTLPNGFNYKNYILINNHLRQMNKLEAEKHYLKVGKKEKLRY